MSVETPEQTMEMGTKPVKEHEWLQKLVGEWRSESEMMMGPDQPPTKATGHEKVTSLGGLFAYVEGTSQMPNGQAMHYKMALGYDVSFKEYRGVWFADVSSHLWRYVGALSPDGRVMTLNCTGPHMEKDGETANYRDVIEFSDENHRTLTSYGQDESGEWQQFMHAKFTRI